MNMSIIKFLINPFHLVGVSPWPLIGSLGALFLTTGMVILFHSGSILLLLIGLTLIILTMYQ